CKGKCKVPKQMKNKEEAEQKKVAQARARVKKKLSQRPSTDIVFNCDKKMLVSHNVEKTPENLANFDKRIAAQILQFDKLSQKQWEEFLREYIVYSAIQSGLNDFDLCFKSSFVGTHEKGCVDPNFVMLTAEYLLPTDNIDALVDMLDTIDHELTHIADERSNIITYQKFDNENGFLPRVFIPDNFRFLQDLLNFEDEKIIDGIADGVYYFTEWEVHARAVAAMHLMRLAKILQSEARKDGFIAGLQLRRNASCFTECVKDIISNEKKRGEFLRKHLDASWPLVQKEFAKVLPVLKQPAFSNYDDANCHKELILNFPLDMASLIAEPELTSQAAFDDLFDFLLRANCTNATPFYEIINAKANSRSAEMLSALYDHIAKNGPATLYSFHKAMLQAGDFAAEEFGKAVVNPKHLNRQMQIQHQKRAASRNLEK
ncbi:MAG: hypothetical protein IKB21_01700, partial [Clostridia bacterium]|nr:hypothetical protein [Clostridia bacterium]